MCRHGRPECECDENLIILGESTLQRQRRLEHTAIDVSYQTTNDKWLVRYEQLYGDGRTLADALHMLANKMDGQRLYGSERYAPETLTGRSKKPCKYCGAPIFFARSRNDKWIPVDHESINATALNGEGRCFALIDAPEGTVVAWLREPQGQVWISHQDVCGTASRPEIPALSERWEQNRRLAEGHNSKIAGELRELVEGI